MVGFMGAIDRFGEKKRTNCPKRGNGQNEPFRTNSVNSNFGFGNQGLNRPIWSKSAKSPEIVEMGQ
jgi:hypothetical protein